MNHYTRRDAALAENLVNTHDVTLPEPEYLRGPTDLDRFLSERGLLPEGCSVTREDLRAVRALRDPIRTVFEAKDGLVAARALNGLLEGATLAPLAETRPDDSWHLGLRVSRDLPLPKRVAVEAALGLVEALGRRGLDRLRACAADPCRDVFVDTSRNGSRRYCGPGCANRHNVASFRSRRRAAGEGG